MYNRVGPVMISEKMDKNNDAKQRVVLAVEETNTRPTKAALCCVQKNHKLKQPHLNVAPDNSVLNHDCIESNMYHVNFLDMFEKT